MLWPDTFNNYFHPQTAMAAVRVLEHAGYRVEIPSVRLCCGRPLYDFGLLDQAKQQLRDILDALRPTIEAGVPLVGLEPACLAVFREEMVNLFPNDALALRLAAQSFMFSEFLVKEARYTPPRLQMKAIVHGHCHQKAVVGMADEVALLGAMGLDFDLLDSGCCGMAGSFGFDKHKVDLSMRIGELVLLPEVRAAAWDTLIITNGYSCQEQIAQGAQRRAIHLAEVIDLAIQRQTSAHPRLHHAERGLREVESVTFGVGVPHPQLPRSRAPEMARVRKPIASSVPTDLPGRRSARRQAPRRRSASVNPFHQRMPSDSSGVGSRSEAPERSGCVIAHLRHLCVDAGSCCRSPSGRLANRAAPLVSADAPKVWASRFLRSAHLPAAVHCCRLSHHLPRSLTLHPTALSDSFTGAGNACFAINL